MWIGGNPRVTRTFRKQEEKKLRQVTTGKCLVTCYQIDDNDSDKTVRARRGAVTRRDASRAVGESVSAGIPRGSQLTRRIAYGHHGAATQAPARPVVDDHVRGLHGVLLLGASRPSQGIGSCASSLHLQYSVVVISDKCFIH